MRLSGLYFFVEGEDDRRFIERIIAPLVGDRYPFVGIYTYAQKGRQKVERMLRSIDSMGMDYIYLADLDSGQYPCVTRRKESICADLTGIKPGRIVVVREEVEGWYLAGVDGEACQSLGLTPFDSTDGLTKEMFIRSLPKGKTRIETMLAILNVYALGAAIERNRSLTYLIRKLQELQAHSA